MPGHCILPDLSLCQSALSSSSHSLSCLSLSCLSLSSHSMLRHSMGGPQYKSPEYSTSSAKAHLPVIEYGQCYLHITWSHTVLARLLPIEKSRDGRLSYPRAELEVQKSDENLLLLKHSVDHTTILVCCQGLLPRLV